MKGQAIDVLGTAKSNSPIIYHIFLRISAEVPESLFGVSSERKRAHFEQTAVSSFL